MSLLLLFRLFAGGQLQKTIQLNYLSYSPHARRTVSGRAGARERKSKEELQDLISLR
jgi:hypothetical protein